MSEEEYQDCPDCPNQGWYVEGNFVGYDSQGFEIWEPVQVQCEFCCTNPLSKFNNLTAPTTTATGGKE